jgi:hypothetical protein
MIDILFLFHFIDYLFSSNRPSASECLTNEWFHHAGQYQISTANLNNFIERRKSQVKSLN